MSLTQLNSLLNIICRSLPSQDIYFLSKYLPSRGNASLFRRQPVRRGRGGGCLDPRLATHPRRWHHPDGAPPNVDVIHRLGFVVDDDDYDGYGATSTEYARNPPPIEGGIHARGLEGRARLLRSRARPVRVFRRRRRRRLLVVRRDFRRRAAVVDAGAGGAAHSSVEGRIHPGGFQGRPELLRRFASPLERGMTVEVSRQGKARPSKFFMALPSSPLQQAGP